MAEETGNSSEESRGAKMNKQHHPSLAPSSMPAIMQCACFESHSDPDRDADQGDTMHDYLALRASGGQPGSMGLEDNVIEACDDVFDQAISFIRDNCPGQLIEPEREMVLKDDSGNVVTFGTTDVFSRGNDFVLILDWKGCLDFDASTKDYHEQLHGYALAGMRECGFKRALCIEAYIMPRKIKPYWVTYNEAAATVEYCIARRNDLNRTPQPCDYCKWCSNLLRCPAVNKRMALITTCYADLPGAESIIDPDKITDPKQMTAALTFARSAEKYIAQIEKAIERIEDAALAMSDRNIEIPFYVRTIKQGNKEITDLGKAFLLSGLNNDEFYTALSCSLPKLAKAYAKKTDLSEKNARKEIEDKLDSVIKRKPEKTTLERVSE
jgi:hypothetical protein